MEGKRLRDLRRRYGLTQAAVARAAGMQQPVLSAIENGRRGTDDAHQRVAAAIRSLVRPRVTLDPSTRAKIRRMIENYGGQEIRVFGSTSRGEDREGSDLDLIARFPADFDLLDLMQLEGDLEVELGIGVDVVVDDARTARALERARAEAVPL
jgi:uncharacterized protein